jgi:hypothetical protein
MAGLTVRGKEREKEREVYSARATCESVKRDGR